MPNRDRRAELRESTRQEILRAAWEVARDGSLATLTLRAVAVRVGMQPPSLYTHFPSKHAIYDAMFEQAWRDYAAQLDEARDEQPTQPREALKWAAASFFDFAVSDLARHQLMNQRTIPGFEPTPAAYQPALDVLGRLRAVLAAAGIDEPESVDLFTALVGGLVDQQMANDPGGTRWRRLLERAIDMYADEIGLPAKRRRTR